MNSVLFPQRQQLCTLRSVVEQITNCKVLNQMLHIDQPKAAPSLEGFATKLHYRTKELKTSASSPSTGTSQSTQVGEVFCCASLLSPWPLLTCHKQHCHDGQVLSTADLTLFWVELWLILPGLSHSEGQTRAFLLVLVKVILLVKLRIQLNSFSKGVPVKEISPIPFQQQLLAPQWFVQW